MILQNSYCITGLDMKTAGRILGVPVSDKGVLEQSWPDCLEEVEVEPKLQILIMVWWYMYMCSCNDACFVRLIILSKIRLLYRRQQ